MKWNARMSYFLTLNWYKTKNRKNTKLRVLVIDFTRHGSSEKNRVGSEKSCFIVSAAGTFYCSSSSSLSVSNSLSTTSSAFSSSFSLSQTALSSEPSTALAIPQDLNNFWIKSLGISFQARLIQANTSSLLGALFFPDRVYVNGLFTIFERLVNALVKGLQNWRQATGNISNVNISSRKEVLDSVG